MSLQPSIRMDLELVTKLRVTGHKSRQYRWKEGEVSVLLAQSLIFYPLKLRAGTYPYSWIRYYITLPLAIVGSSWAICCVHLKGHRHWVEDILHLIWPFPLVEDASTNQTGVYYMIPSVLLCWTGSGRERERDTNTNETARQTGECRLKLNYRL